MRRGLFCDRAKRLPTLKLIVALQKTSHITLQYEGNSAKNFYQLFDNYHIT